MTLGLKHALLSAALGSGLCGFHGVALAQTRTALPAAPAPRPIPDDLSLETEPEGTATVAVDSVMTLEMLEDLALRHNPTIAQGRAIVMRMRGRQWQAGLYPNPTAGYLASEVGNDGEAGQQGYFIEQEFVTAGKLRLDRSVVAQQRKKAECALAAQELRVRNGVRREFYAVLTAERLERLAADLVKVSDESVRITDLRLKRGEGTKIDLLQARIEAETARQTLTSAENTRHAAWKRLHAVVAAPLPGKSLAGDLTAHVPELTWAGVWDRLCATSPQLNAARHDIARAQAAFRRAQVEPIPNIVAQGSHQYDNASRYHVAGAQIGVAIPLFNRNQGNIAAARAEVTEAAREVNRLERSLERALADSFQQYATAAAQAERYREAIIPAAQETLDASRTLYEADEISYLQLQIAQRTYVQVNLQYVEVLGRLWQAAVAVDGLLLTDALASPESLEPDTR